MKALMRHPYTGRVKEVKCGFSFTALFWGFLTPLFRGDFFVAFILFILDVSGIMFSFGTLAIVANTIFGYFYNRMYIKKLFRKGYDPISYHDDLIIDHYLNT